LISPPIIRASAIGARIPPRITGPTAVPLAAYVLRKIEPSLVSTNSPVSV
jgi:hypothetical protein